MSTKADPKTATNLDEVDALKFQNFQLRQQILQGEFSVLSAAIIAKYQAEGEDLKLSSDGSTLIRTKTSEKAVKKA